MVRSWVTRPRRWVSRAETCVAEAAAFTRRSTASWAELAAAVQLAQCLAQADLRPMHGSGRACWCRPYSASAACSAFCSAETSLLRASRSSTGER